MTEGASFSLGGFGPKLTEQPALVAALDFTDLVHFERDDEAISRLFVRGLIPYTVHVRAREKLAAKIKAASEARR